MSLNERTAVAENSASAAAETLPVRAVHAMAKPTGPLCNLRCNYCFYLEKEELYRAGEQWAMHPDVLEAFIRQYIALHDTPEVSFAWQGGEPTLLGVDYFRNVVALQKQYGGARRITNAFQTNGVLLDDEWCAFFAENGFLVGISIDGPKEVHDLHRINRGGAGSFDRTVHAISLLKTHGVEFNTLTVVNRENSQRPLDVYHFLKDAGSKYLQFIPIVERTWPGSGSGDRRFLSPHADAEAGVTEWSVEPDSYGRFLCAIFDEWVRTDVGTVYVQLFDVALESWMNLPPGLCVFRETCGDAVVVEHNGDAYSCDHYVYPENRLGNILDQDLGALAASPQQRGFGEAKRSDLPAECLECPVRFACNGECPKHRFVKSERGPGRINYLCAGYKRFFHHIAPAMNFMASELAKFRAPAHVMQWMRDIDRNPPGRNDPCYCGSGEKFKFCHGA